MTDFTPVLVLAVIFGGIIGIIRAKSDYQFRQRLIDKGAVDEKVQEMLAKSSFGGHNLSNLKWGMVLVAIGAAALIGRFLPYDMDDGGTIGLMFIFAGVAFLIYYPIAQRYERNKGMNPPHN
ncbi:MAG: hypothetical protein HY851_01940 [candidate division Zixibacteria bacterium]|nr:hypothetical protein [candidate division Zixibacteria bacterium]